MWDDGHVKVVASMIVFVGVGVLIIPLAFWTDRNIDFWLTYLKQKPVDCPFLLSYLLCAFTNVFGVVFNLISELARLFLTA